MVGAEPEQGAQVGLGPLDDALEGRRAVAHLHDRHAGAGVVEELRLDPLEDGDGQDGRARPEVVDPRWRGRRHDPSMLPRFSSTFVKPFDPPERLFLQRQKRPRHGPGPRPPLSGVSMDELRSMGSRPTLKDLVEAYERHVIEDALRAASGNQRRAARALGVLPTTLHEKMKRLGLLRRAEPEMAERWRSPAEPSALEGEEQQQRALQARPLRAGRLRAAVVVGKQVDERPAGGVAPRLDPLEVVEGERALEAGDLARGQRSRGIEARPRQPDEPRADRRKPALDDEQVAVRQQGGARWAGTAPPPTRPRTRAGTRAASRPRPARPRPARCSTPPAASRRRAAVARRPCRPWSRGRRCGRRRRSRGARAAAGPAPRRRVRRRRTAPGAAPRNPPPGRRPEPGSRRRSPPCPRGLRPGSPGPRAGRRRGR